METNSVEHVDDAGELTDCEFLRSIYPDVVLSTCSSSHNTYEKGFIVIRFDGKVAYDWIADCSATPELAWKKAREVVGQRMLATLEGNDQII